MDKYKILKKEEQYNLPIFLENKTEDLGVMFNFDGDIEQIEQKCNFTYSGDTMTVRVYNTVNTTLLPELIDSIFTVYWGDGNYENIDMLNVSDTDLPYAEHTYNTNGDYEIKITIESPWSVKEIIKNITIPFVNSFGYPIDLGTLVFTVPYSESVTQTQDYLLDYPTLTGQTENTVISCVGPNLSRLDELKKYGSDEYEGTVSGTTTEGISYIAYTIDNIDYVDYEDGLTYVSVDTSNFENEEIYNGKITRDEHFLGFIEEPKIFSDAFVDRGELSVLERNLRLSEIENMGGLENYGNKYFNVIKT